MNHIPGRGNRMYLVNDVELGDSCSLKVDDMQTNVESTDDGSEPL